MVWLWMLESHFEDVSKSIRKRLSRVFIFTNLPELRVLGMFSYLLSDPWLIVFLFALFVQNLKSENRGKHFWRKSGRDRQTPELMLNRWLFLSSLQPFKTESTPWSRQFSHPSHTSRFIFTHFMLLLLTHTLAYTHTEAPPPHTHLFVFLAKHRQISLSRARTHTYIHKHTHMYTVTNRHTHLQALTQTQNCPSLRIQSFPIKCPNILSNIAKQKDG